MKKEPGFFGKHRYWSIMLVGEHGRVIPVRRFKEIAVVVTGVAFFSSLALIVMGLGYVHQGRTVDYLQTEVDRLQQQANILKDERDVLKAKMVIGSIQSGSNDPEKENAEMEPAPHDSTPAPKNISDQPPVAEQPEKQSASPQWQADIRQFDIDFEPKEKALKARFMIYNVSKPREPLSGRTVLVLKSGDDPPLWLALPSVPLKNGQPSGGAGQAFQVRNYRTMHFDAVAPKTADVFSTATAYVFHENGELLIRRNFDIDVNVGQTAEPEEQDGSTTPEVSEAGSSPDAPVTAVKESDKSPEKVVSDQE
jgi:hypothetical protein